MRCPKTLVLFTVASLGASAPDAKADPPVLATSEVSCANAPYDMAATARYSE